MSIPPTLRISLVVTCLALGSAASGQEPPSLRWSFTPGEELQYEFSQTQKDQTKIEGKELSSTSKLMLDLNWKVKSVEGGVGVITQRLRRARETIKNQTEEITYDSNEKAVPTNAVAKSLYSVFQPVVETEASLNVNSRGEILQAHVGEKVTEALRESPFRGMADGGSVFSDIGLKNLLSQVFPVLPAKAARQGEAWSNSLDISSPPFKMILTSQYSLAGLEKTSARLDAALDLSVKPVGDAPFTVEVNKKTSKGKGTFTFDPTSGHLVKAEVHHSLDFLIKIDGKEVPRTSIIDFELTLKK